mgnify:CR=1 FL=1
MPFILKAAWVNAFEKELTDKQIFHGKEGDTSVDMMHQQDHFEYAENDEYQMIRLPYHGGCEMTVYLPKDSTAADKWSEKDYLYQLGLEADKQEWDRREVSLSMPKFEMEYGNELKDILKELGLEGISMAVFMTDLQMQRWQLDQSTIKQQSKMMKTEQRQQQ